MIKVAERLNHIEEYYFSKKLREVKKLEMEGKPIINMGIGSPDILPPKKISESLEKSLNHKNAHRYQSYKGTDLLRESIKNFYQSNYNVELNSDSDDLDSQLFEDVVGQAHFVRAWCYFSLTRLFGDVPLLLDLPNNENLMNELKVY